MSRRQGTAARRESAAAKSPGGVDVAAVLATLERLGTPREREGMARYGIVARQLFGVSVGAVQKLAKGLGRSHALALALWDSGWYEARLLAAFVDEPERVTVAQMERWARDFENWGDCDTVCFTLFDRTPHAFGRVEKWAGRREEFVKRAAFALLASLALHDRSSGDEVFLRCLPLVERAAADERNFVKKGVLWALRGVGERGPALHAAAIELATRLAAVPAAAPRWVGKSALRELSSPAARARLARRAGRGAS